MGAAFGGQFALVLATLAFSVGCRPGGPAPDQRDAPPLALSPSGLDGRPLDPLADGKPGVAVLTFVTTQCPISNRYAPTLRAIHDEYSDRGVAFYLVYPDPDDDANAIQDHLRAFDLPGIAVRDPGHQLVSAAAATVTPEAAVFVGDGGHPALAYHGRIDDRARDFGNVRAQATHRDLITTLDAVLAGQPVPNPETKAVGCYIVDLQ